MAIPIKLKQKFPCWSECTTEMHYAATLPVQNEFERKKEKKSSNI